MASFYTYNYVEVIYTFNPFVIECDKYRIDDYLIEERMGNLSELYSLSYKNTSKYENNMKLWIVDTNEYLLNEIKFDDIFNNKTNDLYENFLILIENQSNLLTIRQRKKLQINLFNNWIINNLFFPYTLQNIKIEINKASKNILLNANNSIFRSVLSLREIEAQAINDVGSAMMGQSSSNEILKLVLDKSVLLSNADAGFLLIKENLLKEHEHELKEKIKQNPNCFSLKGRVCKSQNLWLSKKMLNINESELLALVVNRSLVFSWFEDNFKISIKSLDANFNLDNIPNLELVYDVNSYKIKSFCILPIRTPNQEVIGIILLINKRKKSNIFCDSIEEIDELVTSFSNHDLNILDSLANQTGISLDYTRLYKELKLAFESFIHASVIAIESRDPSTRGHSERVAKLTVALAEAVNKTKEGQYKNIEFTQNQLYELQYAALLHDFGKIGVKEIILTKGRKLYYHELLSIKERFILTEKKFHIDLLENYIQMLINNSYIATEGKFLEIKSEIKELSEQLLGFWQQICETNEANILSQDNFNKIINVSSLKFTNEKNEDIKLLFKNEIDKLSIKKGSLSAEERKEIESHVAHSYNFLTQIPWSRELANIPDIVYAHHERLNGTGYPRNLKGEDIPIQARILAIADIYDALLTSDRHYKKVVPKDRAIDILAEEVREGKLDASLLEIFLHAHLPDFFDYLNIKIA